MKSKWQSVTKSMEEEYPPIPVRLPCSTSRVFHPFPDDSILSRAGVKGKRELLPSSVFPSNYTSDFAPTDEETSWKFLGIPQEEEGRYVWEQEAGKFQILPV